MGNVTALRSDMRCVAGTGAVGRHLDNLRLRGLSPGTVEARRRALARLGRALPGGLLAAGPGDLAAWRAGLRLAPKTVGCYVSHAYQFYEWAVVTGLLEANPAGGLPVPRPPRRLPRPVSEADLLLALAAAPARVRPWLVLAAWAGLRAKEIALLRRECVLDHAASPVILVADGATKGHTEHVVPMSTFVLAELRPVLPARGWVFRRADGRPGPNDPATVSHVANRHLHSCGIAATLHQLRHRFGTQTYRISRDLRAVQELLGHADPASAALYAAYDNAAAAAAVEAIPAPGPRFTETKKTG